MQSAIEDAIRKITAHEVSVVGCGRTDTGVHALYYVAHFESDAVIPDSFNYRLNAVLPPDIAILDSMQVPDAFHARFSALSRTYLYKIHFAKNPFLIHRSWFQHRIPDVEAMNRASELLMTFDDFACFCKQGGDNKTTRCRIMEAVWNQTGDQLQFTIRADRFLRNMVRAIVGTLVEVGNHELELEELREIILSGNRSMAGTSVPAHGLYLSDVRYPDEH